MVTLFRSLSLFLVLAVELQSGLISSLESYLLIHICTGSISSIILSSNSGNECITFCNSSSAIQTLNFVQTSSASLLFVSSNSQLELKYCLIQSFAAKASPSIYTEGSVTLNHFSVTVSDSNLCHSTLPSPISASSTGPAPVPSVLRILHSSFHDLHFADPNSSFFSSGSLSSQLLQGCSFHNVTFIDRDYHHYNSISGECVLSDTTVSDGDEGI